MRSVTVSPVRRRTGFAWGTGAVGAAVSGGATAGVGGNSGERSDVLSLISARGGGSTSSPDGGGCAASAAAQISRAATVRERGRRNRSLTVAARFTLFLPMIPLRRGRRPSALLRRQPRQPTAAEPLRRRFLPGRQLGDARPLHIIEQLLRGAQDVEASQLQVVPRRPAVGVGLEQVDLRSQHFDADGLLLLVQALLPLQQLVTQPQFRFLLFPLADGLLPAVPGIAGVGGHVDQGSL